jgi:hypothetical protein
MKSPNYDFAPDGFAHDDWANNTMIPRIKFTKKLFRTMFKLDILKPDPMPQHEIDLMAQHPDWAENIQRQHNEKMPRYTGLKECKDYVERLRDKAIDKQLLGED